jgi:DNA helicase HerA-like ATPase
MSADPQLLLGAYRALHNPAQGRAARLPAHHLTTHAVVVGMTGSGKSGLVTVMAEEALRAEVPVLIIDVKGDLPNLLLRFPQLTAEALLPWVEGKASPSDKRTPEVRAAALAETQRKGLLGWDITERAVAEYVARSDIRVITPGSSAGEQLHVLSSLERRSELWDADPESARASLSAAVSLVLRLLGVNLPRLA